MLDFFEAKYRQTLLKRERAEDTLEYNLLSRRFQAIINDHSRDSSQKSSKSHFNTLINHKRPTGKVLSLPKESLCFPFLLKESLSNYIIMIQKLQQMEKEELESVDSQVFGQLWSLYQIKYVQDTLDRVTNLKVKSMLKFSIIQFQLLLFLLQICLILIKSLVLSDDIIFIVKVQNAVKQTANCLLYFCKYLIYKFTSKEIVKEQQIIMSLFNRVNKHNSINPLPIIQKQSVINSDTIRQLLLLLPY